MSKSVDRAWTTQLWSRLDALARERDVPLELRMRWPESAEDVWFDVRVSDGKPRAVVDDHVIEMLQRVSPDDVRARVTDPDQRDRWPSRADTVRASRGSTIAFTLAASTIAAPLAGWRALTVDIYRNFEVDQASLIPLLPPDVMRRVQDDERRRLDLRRLGELLGITVYKPASPDADPQALQAPSSADRHAASSTGELSPGEGASIESAAAATSGDDDDEEDDGAIWRSRNVIFFGPPGTGKSHQLEQRVRSHLGVRSDARILRVTFHPEYTYFDFIGNYRPAVGWLTVEGARFQPELPGSEPRSAEPRTYYVFDPGPLSLAIATATCAPEENVALVVEEINRGNCAAIFGDVFQLLDRKSDISRPDEIGLSQYPINPTGPWSDWLERNLAKGSAAWCEGQLRLPRNLFIYATMNTSDQSLFPMDTAFRRRWNMEFVGVDSSEPLTLVPLQHDLYVRWSDMLVPLNRAIVEHTGSDDKQLGPWFVRARQPDNRVEPAEFSSKVLFYLWSDVFRESPEKLFREDLRTYDQLVRAFRDRKPVFCAEIHRALVALASAPETAAAAPTPDDLTRPVASASQA